jgi:hypothetical protein
MADPKKGRVYIQLFARHLRVKIEFEAILDAIDDKKSPSEAYLR